MRRGFVLMLMLWASPVSADPHALAQLRLKVETRFAATCIVPHGLGNLLDVTVDGTQIVRSWDRNYDGQKDAETYSELIGGPNAERPFPYKFLLDDDFDGVPDRKFLDLSGDGDCALIREVPMGQGRES